MFGRCLSVVLVAAATMAPMFACSFDRAYRQDPIPEGSLTCKVGLTRCDQTLRQVCGLGIDGRPGWLTEEDCATRRLACADDQPPTIVGASCKPCRPTTKTCGG